MKHLTKVIFISLLCTYFFLGISTIFLADLELSDENWHFSASSLVAQGKIPYRDFAYFHMPLLPYFYGLIMFVFGTNLIAGRFVSFLLGFLTLIFIYLAAKRLKNEIAGIFAILLVVFNYDIVYYSTFFYWAPLENFLFSLFCFSLVSNLKPEIKYSLATALLVFAQGVRYALDYVTIYTLLFVIFTVFTNKKNKRVIAMVIVSYLGASLLLYLPGLLFAPKEFLYGTLTHYVTKGGAFISGGYDGKPLIWFYNRLKMLIVLFRNYYIFALSFLLMISYGLYQFFHNALIRKNIISVILQHKIHSILISLFLLNAVFHLVIFGPHLRNFFYHAFPALAVIIGCSMVRITEYFNSYKVKLFFSYFVFLAVILSFFGQDLEIHISSPQYSGAKFLNEVSLAIRRHSDPEDKIFAFMNGYVLQAQRQIFPDTIYEISETSLFPKLSDQEAKEYHLLSPNILLSYFQEKKAKLIVLERPGRLDLATMKKYKDEVEKALSQNYYLAEKVYKYSRTELLEPVVYIYKAK